MRAQRACRRLLTAILIGAVLGGILVALDVVQPGSAERLTLPNLFPFMNESGILQTYNINGPIDLDGPFFQSLGTNGRTCSSCHLPDQGWSISADRTKARFIGTAGLDPIFRTNDGSNCDHDIDVSTLEGRRLAYSLLISRGLIRVEVPVPASAEFEVTGVNNPYGCGDRTAISTYRRVLPTTNLRFISAVMWDGRQSTPPSTEKITYVTNPNDLLFNLRHQAMDATTGHAEGAFPISAEQEQDIVAFEMGLSTAQVYDFDAGLLTNGRVNGGPVPLSTQHFFIGINDPLGENPFGTLFTPVVFDLFGAWADPRPPFQNAKASIARGEALFNSKPVHITGVAGLNDDLGADDIPGTCGTCHDSPNVGNHSVPVPLNIGVGDVTNPLGVGYLPIITLRNKATGSVVETTDPGRALITGKWRDIGKMKGPVLRGLASRAPYFHNGSAETLNDVVLFYNLRFDIGLTDEEQADLVAFLKAL